MTEPESNSSTSPLEPVLERSSIVARSFQARHRLVLHGPFKGPWLELSVEFPPLGIVDLLVEIRFEGGGASYRKPTVTERNTFELSFRTQRRIKDIVLHVEGNGDLQHPVRAAIATPSRVSRILSLTGLALRRFVADPRGFVSSAIWFLERMSLGQAISLPGRRTTLPEHEAYQRWLTLFDDRPEVERSRYLELLQLIRKPPKISVLAPIDSAAEANLVISGLASQIYPNWELILAVAPDASVADHDDERVKLVSTDTPSRAGCLNQALSAATGEFVLALPQHGRLRIHALLEGALALDANPMAVLAYGDEDVIEPDLTRHSPRFKPGWSPHLALSHDYMGDPAFLSASAVRAIGGWREDISGVEDHDIKLRLTEAIDPNAIVHIPKILLHRIGRVCHGSAPRLGAVAAHAARQGGSLEVTADPRSPHPRLVRRHEDAPLVSVIVPTRDRAALLEMCVSSLLSRTSYSALEVIVVDNGSVEAETFALFRALGKDDRVRVLPQPGPFNFSALNNAAVRLAQGTILALVNNDIEVLAGDWLDEMVGYAREPAVGCVGAKLYFPNGTLQHAGIVTGLVGGAGHLDKHAPRDARGYLDRLVTVRDVSAVTAACLVVRKRVYEEVGGLDEAFEIAFNDVDFCLRVEAAGYRNVWTPFAELIHHESISRGHDLRNREKARRLALELEALERRWGTRLLTDPYYSPHLSQQSEAGGIRVA